MPTISKELLIDYVKEQNLTGQNDVLDAMKNMIKIILQETLEAEMDSHLSHDKHDPKVNQTKNKRNGYTIKAIQTGLGPVKIAIPRDINDTFEPKIISKYQRYINRIEDIIMTLYAYGMTTENILIQIKNLYNEEISSDIVSRISKRIIPIITEWQNRPLESSYFIVFIDSIQYKVHEGKKIVLKTAYIAIGMNMDTKNEILGMWVETNERTKFRHSALNDLTNRGINDISIFCVSNLKRFISEIERLSYCIDTTLYNSSNQSRYDMYIKQ